MNVGASAPEEAGQYFSWGNTDGHTQGDGYEFTQARYNNTPGVELTGNIPISQDAARVNMGGSWRMPTKADFKELYDNCTSVWTTINGVAGRLFTSNINGNTIFLPAAGLYDGTELVSPGEQGDYWSSSYDSPTSAFILYASSEEVIDRDNSERYCGIPIRAVQD